MSRAAGDVVLPPASERALDLLRGYLDDIGFVRLHKYLLSAGLYHVNPHLIRQGQREAVGAIHTYTSGNVAELGLALCLLADVPLADDALPDRLVPAAEALLEAGLLLRRGRQLRMGAFQLISVQGMPLLIDHRMNFSRAMHEVYIGPDSLLLGYYLDLASLPASARGLDLGTGTGILALCLARCCEAVTATDIMPAPLWLAAANCRLNGQESRVQLRREAYLETIARGETFDVVTFNPPFVALPDGMRAPVYAKGRGTDGLDDIRMLLELFDHIVAPAGTAYIVADLLGDEHQPHFVVEMRRYADLLGLAMDVFIESRLDLRTSGQHEALARGLCTQNPHLDPEQVLRQVRQLQMEELRAVCTYCTVIVARRTGPPGVRVFSRFCSPQPSMRG